MINLFIQYTPYSPSDGHWGDPVYRVSFPTYVIYFIPHGVHSHFFSLTNPLKTAWHPLQESFAQKCFTLIDEYAPGFSSSIIGYDMLTPPDLEREIGLTGTSNLCPNVGSMFRLFKFTVNDTRILAEIPAIDHHHNTRR